MNNSKYTIILVLLLALGFSSCQQKYKPGHGLKEVPEGRIDIPEIEALLTFMGNSGDYINSPTFPSLVNAEDVYENLNRYYVIDIRKNEDYRAGHINEAVNIDIPNLLEYLNKTVAASAYEKLVIVCKNGQTSAYVTGVLRLLGYSNAYSMSYGMSSWNPSINHWSERVSNKYAAKLEKKENTLVKTYPFPPIKTGQSCGAEILNARGVTLFNTPTNRLMIKADRAFDELDEFHIIAYMPKTIYDQGHIPGAFHYEPKKSFSKEGLLNTLPSNNKKILVYDYTGQTAAFLMAYLRLLGYNAFTMPMGANSFMYDILKANGKPVFEKSKKVSDFPLIKGNTPTDKEFEKHIGSSAPPPKKVKRVIKRKKKEVEGGCS